MEFNIRKDILTEALKKVMGAISNKPVIPILSGVQVVANSDGLTLTGSDSNLSIKAFVSAKELDDIEVIEEGTIVLPAKQLSNIAKAMPKHKIKIKKDNLKVIISSGKSNFSLNGTDGQEYPRLPEIDGMSFTIKGEDLITLINKTLYAVAKTETRPVLTGVNLFFDNNKLGVVATDSHRLSRLVGKEIEGNQLSESVTLPAKTLKELPSIIGESENVAVQLKNSQILFKTDDVFVLSRLIEGTYPQTDRLIPTEYKTTLKVNRMSFISSIERSSILAENSVVTLKIDGKSSGIFQTIELSHNHSEIGQSKEDIIVDSIEGDEITLSFNSKYMMEALKRIDEETVFIGFNGSMRPILIKGENNIDHVQIVLPVRTYN